MLSVVMSRYARAWCDLCRATVATYKGVCNGPIRKPLAHRLHDVNQSERTAVCVWCGPIKLIRSGACENAWRSNRINGAGHGLTQGEVRSRLHKAVCNICGAPAQHVDHCHASGRIRGVLCRFCNLGLGHFRDRPELLLRAAEYLREEK